MKVLIKKQEIVEALNSNKYPVVTIDFAKNGLTIVGDKLCGFEGSPVKIAWGYNGETYYTKATLQWFEDEKKFRFNQDPSILTSGFGYGDILDLCETAKAPELKANQEFILVMYNSQSKKAVNPIVLRTGKKVNKMCSTILGVESEEKIDLLDLYKKSL